jgi:biotin carboxyl carrier protein
LPAQTLKAGDRVEKDQVFGIIEDMELKYELEVGRELRCRHAEPA